MAYIYKNKGTCSVQTEVELNPDHTIKSVKVLGGCDGNLKGIEGDGPDTQTVMESYSDQISQALKGALAELG